MKKALPRILVFRLSSLGDILLATSFLENLPDQVEVDWVVRSEFEFALKGHPKIHRLIPFSKKNGLRGWIKLIKTFSSETYVARVDLHRNLRSAIAMCFLRLCDLKKFHFLPHYRISKERIRTGFYFLVKELTPRFLRPTPYWIRFARVGAELRARVQVGVGKKVKLELAPPSFAPVLAASGHNEKLVLSEYDLFPGKYFAVMPAASFRTKEWGVERYQELIERHLSSLTPVLVGRESDPACLELRAALQNAKIFFKDALFEPDFKKTAILLKYSQFYIGSDTGLAHLTEAVGVRAYVIFGPTRPGLGFGPWRKESQSVSLPLACSPCSKDGKFCYRFFAPYACLKNLEVQEVRRRIAL